MRDIAVIHNRHPVAQGIIKCDTCRRILVGIRQQGLGDGHRDGLRDRHGVRTRVRHPHTLGCCGLCGGGVGDLSGVEVGLGYAVGAGAGLACGGGEAGDDAGQGGDQGVGDGDAGQGHIACIGGGDGVGQDLAH